jgi:hypothetical protein
MAIDFTHAGPSAVSAFTAEWESRVRIGTAEHYGSLAVTGSTYNATYDWASVGLQSSYALDLGQLASPPNIEPLVSFEEVESGNTKSSGLYALKEEGLKITISVKEWNPAVMEQAITNGSMTTVNTNERLFRAGGACTIRNRPLEVSAYNIGCSAPAASNSSAGIQGWILTVYGGYISSGWKMGDISPRETSTVELEYTAIPWMSRALGNRLYNLLVY